MLAELAGLAQLYPEANIAEVAEQHGVRLPASAAGPLGTPPSSAGGSRGSRPVSARSGGGGGGSRPVSMR